MHWPPSTHDGNSNQLFQAGIFCSMHPCFAFHWGGAPVSSAHLSAKSKSHGSETAGQVLALALETRWLLAQHRGEKEHLHTHLPWALLGATCGYKSRLQISHRGSQEWSGSTQRSSCVCQIFLLWMYPFTFEEKNFQVWRGKTVPLFGFFTRNLSCKIWRIRKV